MEYKELKTKKSLGQNFLRDRNILRAIVEAADLSPSDTVLEVGPGEGTLTELLLEKAGKVIAVEKDDRLIPRLKDGFADDIASGKLKLAHDDILTLATENYKLKTKNWKVVANIPYYITGQFLRKFLESENQPTSMTLLLQKEVAERIVANGGKENLLSISVKCYGEPKYVKTVKAGSFNPPPKVDSAILTIQNISKKFFGVTRGGALPSTGQRMDICETEKRFFEILKKGFSHKRKLLSKNLGISQDILSNFGIDTNARAEDLSRNDWKNLLETTPCNISLY